MKLNLQQGFELKMILIETQLLAVVLSMERYEYPPKDNPIKIPSLYFPQCLKTKLILKNELRVIYVYLRLTVTMTKD